MVNLPAEPVDNLNQLLDMNYQLFMKLPENTTDAQKISTLNLTCDYIKQSILISKELRYNSNPICDFGYLEDVEANVLKDLANTRNKYGLIVLMNPSKELYVKTVLQDNRKINPLTVKTPVFSEFVSVSSENPLGHSVIKSVKRFAQFGLLKLWYNIDHNLELYQTTTWKRTKDKEHLARKRWHNSNSSGVNSEYLYLVGYSFWFFSGNFPPGNFFSEFKTKRATRNVLKYSEQPNYAPTFIQCMLNIKDLDHSEVETNNFKLLVSFYCIDIINR